MLRVATFNVNSVRTRLPIILAWLDTYTPDVFCMQETKVQDEQFPRDAFTEAGYHVLMSGQKSYNGVAIATRRPASLLAIGLDDGGPPDRARLIAAVLDGTVVVNTYVPQGRDPSHEDFEYKLQWLARLKAWFTNHFDPSVPLLWMGDFNVAPEEIDVHDPVRLNGHVGFHPREREALADLKSWGFVDVFRRHVESGGTYTFFDYRAKDAVARGIGWRVDHIWATSPLAQRSSAAWIDLGPRTVARPSDHTVLAAEFS